MTTRIAALIVGLAGGATLLQSGPPQEIDRLVGGEPVSVGPDRVAAGLSVLLADSVPGDAMAAGGQVAVESAVGGDVLGAGGRVEISGPVAGSVRAAGGWVELRSSVRRNATLAGGQVIVAGGGGVTGNAYLAGGTVEISGPVGGHLLVGGGDVVLDGRVSGNVEIAADRLTLGPDARVAGDLRYRSPAPVERAPDAVVGGEVTRAPLEEPPAPGWAPSLPGWIGTLLGLAAFLLTGVALAALFPTSASRMLRTGRESPLPSLGVGVLVLLVAPALLLGAAITLIGLPLALVGGALFAFSLYVGRAVLALWIGDAMLRNGGGRRGILLAFLAGGALLYLVGLVPWVGTAVTVAATAFGLGAAALTLRRGGRTGPAAESSAAG